MLSDRDIIIDFIIEELEAKDKQYGQAHHAQPEQPEQEARKLQVH